MLKKVIGRLLERYAEEIDIILHGYGSTTFREEFKAKALEPDECYSIDTLKDVPDIALEINLTSEGLDKLIIYKSLGISEVLVWKNNALTLYDLRSDHPQIIKGSQLFPELDLTLLTQHISPHN